MCTACLLSLSRVLCLILSILCSSCRLWSFYRIWGFDFAVCTIEHRLHCFDNLRAVWQEKFEGNSTLAIQQSWKFALPLEAGAGMLPLQMPEGKWQRHINAACKARNEHHLPSLSSSKAACEFFMVSWIDVRKPTSSSIIKNISCICICIYLFLNFSISLFIYLSIYLPIYIHLYIKQQWPQLTTNISESPWLRKNKLSGLQAFDQHRMPSCPAGMITSTTHPDPSIQWSKVSEGFRYQPAICAIPLLRIFQVGNLSLHTFLEATNSDDFSWELVPVSGQLEAFS